RGAAGKRRRRATNYLRLGSLNYRERPSHSLVGWVEFSRPTDGGWWVSKTRPTLQNGLALNSPTDAANFQPAGPPIRAIRNSHSRSRRCLPPRSENPDCFHALPPPFPSSPVGRPAAATVRREGHAHKSTCRKLDPIQFPA